MRRKFINDFLIDDSPMLNPDRGVEYEENDLLSNDSGRDEGGYLHNFVIRYGIKSWKFSYSYLDKEEYKCLVSLLRGKTRFKFTYQDENGSSKETLAYCVQRKVSYWSTVRSLYKDLEFEIVEC